MIFTYYTDYKGGINNLAVAVDGITGLSATSKIDGKTARNNLKRKLSKLYQKAYNKQ